MKIRPELNYLFNQTGAKRWLSRPRLPRPGALMPLTTNDRPEANKENFLYSTDSRALKITEELMKRLNDAFPVDVLPSGFAGPTTIPGNFNALLNVTGCGMDPLPIPVTNNAALIAKDGLRSTIRDEDAPYLKELIRLFFGHAVPSNLHIRKAASTGFPYFTNDVQYKKLATLKILWNIDEWLDMMAGPSSGLQGALAEYHSILLYAIQERQQPNAIIRDAKGCLSSKSRITPTEKEARSGDFSGGTIADMTVHDEHGNPIPGHFAMRRRDVFGGNGPVNYVLTAIMNSFRDVYLSRFAFTYKTRDRHDKQRKIAPYAYVIGSDVKTMDKMIPEWFTSFVMNELPKYLDERVVKVMNRLIRAPYVVPSPWVRTSPDYDPVFGDSPLRDTSFTMHVGLPSGIAFNPDWGKLWMTFVYMILYKDIGAIYSTRDLEPLLRGLNKEHALQDMSDDAAFLTNSAIIAKRLQNPKSPYAVLEVETPVIFLGDVYCEVDGKKEVYPNPITYVVNAMCREDSIDRQPVQAWGEGVLARMQVYSHNPIFRDLNAIYEETVRKHTGVNPTLLARALAKQQRFNDVDALVRMSPGVLHYKVDPKDVSPEVLDELVSTIPATDFFNKIRHLFKVPVVALEELI